MKIHYHPGFDVLAGRVMNFHHLYPHDQYPRKVFVCLSRVSSFCKYLLHRELHSEKVSYADICTKYVQPAVLSAFYGAG